MAANEARLQRIETTSNPCLVSDLSILQPLQPLQSVQSQAEGTTPKSYPFGLLDSTFEDCGILAG